MERTEKREFVTSMKSELADAGAVVVAHYAGLTVADMSALRIQMTAAGGAVKVAKNRLVKLALEGTDSDHISDLFKGQTLVCYSEDPVSAPKVAVEFAKTNEKLVVLGGAMGATNLDPNGVKALASLPSLDELRGKIVGFVQAPATKIVRVINAPASQVARVVGAYAAKGEAA